MSRWQVVFSAWVVLFLDQRQVCCAQGPIITTVVGGSIGDGDLAVRASLASPFGACVDGQGNIYIADREHDRIRKVAFGTGIITTVAGDGTRGYSGDGGLATKSNLNLPEDVFVDGSGNIYIADAGNFRIRRVAFDTGIITTVAGNGTQGTSGDGGPATNARLSNWLGLFVDGSGNIYIAETGSHRIRKVALGTGTISTVAGNGTSGYAGDDSAATNARLSSPKRVFVDNSGNIFIPDSNNHRIRKVAFDTGIITTVAGDGTGEYSGDDGLAINASLYYPNGVCVGGSGEMYISDGSNNRIRKVAVGTGIISTAAGRYFDFTVSGDGDGGPATKAFLFSPRLVFSDSSGNFYFTDYASSRIRKVTISTGIISTAAGGSPGDGGLATSANLRRPQGVAVDGSGNIFIADTHNGRIRKLTISTGVITTVAGNGAQGDSPDGGAATNTKLSYPTGVAVDGLGNIYIADSGNNRIRKVANGTGIITTVAGTGGGGLAFSGDGGPATEARLGDPNAVFVDGLGNIYIADSDHHRIHKVAAETGILTTVAGNGIEGDSGDGGAATSASLSDPEGVCVDRLGNIYIAAINSRRIRKVAFDTGIITTVAGGGPSVAGYGDGGPATSAIMYGPGGVFVDDSGNIYIADTFHSRIRKVEANTGTISTMAGIGNGTQDFSGDGGSATSASLNSPRGIAVDGAGNIYIADTSNDRVRKITAASVALTGIDTTPGISVSPISVNAGEIPIGASKIDSFTVSNTGTAPLVVSDITSVEADALQFGLSPKAFTLNLGGTGRTVRVIFSPTALGAKSATYSIVHNAFGSPTPITLSMVGTAAVDPPKFSGPKRVTLAATAIGSTTLQTFTISNPGGSPLVITGITRSGAASRQFGIAPTSATIPVGGSQSFTVTFAPISLGTKTTTLAMAHNGSDSPTRISVQGRAVRVLARLQLSPANVVMDQTVVGGQSQKTFTIGNTGGGTLSITQITIEGSSGPLFSVDPGNASIPGGSSRTFTVTFKPTTTGMKIATLTIVHNAQGGPATVRMRGQAIRGSGLVVAEGEGGAGLVQKPVEEGAQLELTLPAAVVLAPNYPNPFNPETIIRYQLPGTTQVSLEVYDLLGQKVRTLVSQVQEEGYYRQIWDSRDDGGGVVGSGVYFYRLHAGDFSQTRKLLLAK